MKSFHPKSEAGITLAIWKTMRDQHHRKTGREPTVALAGKLYFHQLLGTLMTVFDREFNVTEAHEKGIFEYEGVPVYYSASLPEGGIHFGSREP